MKHLQIVTLAFGCTLPLVSAGAPARAEVFDWSLTGPAASLGGVPFPGSGTITATESTTPGVWDVTAITGTVDGSAITGLTTFRSADNLVYTNGFAFLGTNGISFETSAEQNVNIFSFFSQGAPPTGNAYGEFASPGGFGVGTFTLTVVPEPSTWAMMVVGFVGLAYAGYRSRSRAAASLI